MTLRARAVLVLLAAIVSSGCGATSGSATLTATHAPSATTCYVGIYFVRSDTAAERTAVATALRDDPLIASFRYVSRAEALAIERKKAPALVKSLTSNPLPDRFTAVPKPRVSAYRVITELKARRFRGVRTVDGYTADSSGCGFTP